MPSGFSHSCLRVNLVPQAIAGQDQQLIPTLQGVLVKLGDTDQGSPKDMLPTCHFPCGLQTCIACMMSIQICLSILVHVGMLQALSADSREQCLDRVSWLNGWLAVWWFACLLWCLRCLFVHILIDTNRSKGCSRACTDIHKVADDCGEQKGTSLCSTTTSNCTLCKRRPGFLRLVQQQVAPISVIVGSVHSHQPHSASEPVMLLCSDTSKAKG